MEPLTLVYLGFFAVMIYSTTLWILVYGFNRSDVHYDPDAADLPGVTFLVPAYNEEDTVSETLERLLSLDYPEDKLDIIAINDGSTDNTLERMQEFKDEITIIDKENGGKAHALNTGLELVETPYVACMDADSFPTENFLKTMMGRLEEDRVKGVTPAFLVRMPERWAEKVIWTEYVFQTFLRKMFALFDAQYVMPGPGSVYDTSIVRELGGWDEETLTEDMEIALRMYEQGYRIENSTNAYVETETPPTLRELFRQRIRWYRGGINNYLKYRHMIGRREHGNLGMFLIPFNLIWLVVIISVVGRTLYTLLNVVYTNIHQALLVGFQPPTFSLSMQSLHMFHLFAAFFALSGVANVLLSLRTADEDIALRERKLHYVLFLSIYPVLFGLFWIAAIITELMKGERAW